MRTEIILSRTGPETWIAVREDGRVVELAIHRENQRSLVGNVYLGKVNRVLPGMQSAFVDIGLDRDAFLYAGDMPDAGAPPPAEADREDGDDAPAAGTAPPPPDIRRLVRQGQAVMVQVTKDALGTKGARLSGVVTLPGHRLVLLPQVAHLGISRRIDDPEERERLRAAVEPLQPEGGGFIVRTVARGAETDDFRAEAETLVRRWESIAATASRSTAPCLLDTEEDLPLKILRDHAGPGLERVLVDDEALRDRCVGFLRDAASELADRVTLHAGPARLLDEENITAVIDGALRNRVWLRSGGHLVINQTEALVAIDVNTGRYVGTRNLEDTALTVNLEAVEEIARQIRLRDLGGIIVVDFIDMVREESRRALLEAVGRELERDRSHTRLLGVSEFGLVQLTRKRTRRSLERNVCRPCPYCSGRGRVRSAASVAGEIVRALRRAGPGEGRRPARVRVHPDVAELLEGEREAWLGAGGDAPAVEIVADPALHREAFELIAG